MKRIVVTGAKGGTGVSICKVLRAAGYEVLGIDLKPVEFGESGYARHDLLDGAGLHDLLAGADGVVHFGSYPTDAWSSWSEAFRNVTVGGFSIYQACANLGIKRIALASSGTFPRTPLRDSAPETPDPRPCVSTGRREADSGSPRRGVRRVFPVAR